MSVSNGQMTEIWWEWLCDVVTGICNKRIAAASCEWKWTTRRTRSLTPQIRVIRTFISSHVSCLFQWVCGWWVFSPLLCSFGNARLTCQFGQFVIWIVHAHVLGRYVFLTQRYYYTLNINNTLKFNETIEIHLVMFCYTRMKFCFSLLVALFWNWFPWNHNINL